MWSVVWLSHSLSVNSPVRGHEGCYQVWVFVDVHINSAVSTCVCVFAGVSRRRSFPRCKLFVVRDSWCLRLPRCKPKPGC